MTIETPNKVAKSSLFLDTLHGKSTVVPPIWMMRQAGRYLPEYRKVRAQVKDFMTLCRTPDLVTSITMQPIDRFSLDAAIIFSDILTIPDALGCQVHFIEGQGPILKNPINTEYQVKNLNVLETSSISYVTEGLFQTKKVLPEHIPLIGFSGCPFTLSCYMIDGQHTKGFPRTIEMIYKRPDLFESIIDILVDAVKKYVLAQISSGADVIMLFDTWAGMLSCQYQILYSVSPLEKIISFIKRKAPHIPIIIFPKGVNQDTHRLFLSMDIQAIGCDSGVCLKSMSSKISSINKKIAIQGNLDPSALCYSQDKEQVWTQTNAVL